MIRKQTMWREMKKIRWEVRREVAHFLEESQTKFLGHRKTSHASGNERDTMKN